MMRFIGGVRCSRLSSRAEEQLSRVQSMLDSKT